MPPPSPLPLYGVQPAAFHTRRISSGRLTILTKSCCAADGTLDFYQIHTYPTGQGFSKSSPLRVSADQLELDKPVIIGEFAVKPCQSSQGCDVVTEYHTAASTNYSGIWDWSLLASDSMDDSATALKGKQ